MKAQFLSTLEFNVIKPIVIKNGIKSIPIPFLTTNEAYQFLINQIDWQIKNAKKYRRDFTPEILPYEKVAKNHQDYNDDNSECDQRYITVASFDGCEFTFDCEVDSMSILDIMSAPGSSKGSAMFDDKCLDVYSVLNDAMKRINQIKSQMGNSLYGLQV